MTNKSDPKKGSRVASIVLVCLMCALFWAAWQKFTNNADYASALLYVGLALLGLWSIGAFSDLKSLYRRIRKYDEVDKRG